VQNLKTLAVSDKIVIVLLDGKDELRARNSFVTGAKKL